MILTVWVTLTPWVTMTLGNHDTIGNHDTMNAFLWSSNIDIADVAFVAVKINYHCWVCCHCNIEWNHLWMTYIRLNKATEHRGVFPTRDQLAVLSPIVCISKCSVHVGNIRNLAMEKVATTVMFPCKYSSSGCPVTLLHTDKQEHEETCEYR